MKVRFFRFAVLMLAVMVTSCGREKFSYTHIQGGPIQLDVTASANRTKSNPMSFSRSIEMSSDSDDAPLYLHEYVTRDWVCNLANSTTKGVIVTDGALHNGEYSGDFYVNEFHMEAFFTEEPSEEMASEHPYGHYFSENAFYNDSEGEWKLGDEPYMWPGVPVRFWSVYPKEAGVGSNVNYEDGDFSSSGACVVLNYGKGNPVDGETDILVACTTAESGKVSVNFNHVTSAIQFMDVSADGLVIKSASIRGVSAGAKCKVSADGTIVWDEYTDGTVYTHLVADGQSIADDDMVFFVTPQILHNGASIVLTYQDTATNVTHERVVYLARDGQSMEWRPGYKYTYRLSANPMEWEYVVEPIEDVEAGWMGTMGGDDYEVVSYKRDIATGVKVMLQAAMEYSLDGGVNWIQYEAPIGDEDDKEEEEVEIIDGWLVLGYDDCYGEEWAEEEGFVGFYWPYVLPVMADSQLDNAVVDKHATALRSNSIVSSASSPYDLSMHDVYGNPRESGTPVTANCYVVKAPGHYMFPLVYGNAVDFTRSANGNNKEAYAPTCTDIGYDISHFLSPFLNYRNAGITSPFIENDLGISAQSPCLVWQDVTSEIVRGESLRLVDSPSGAPLACRYLCFDIAPEDIKQGNVVIAIKDGSGNVMWSWHIWVTDDDLTAQMVAADDIDSYGNAPQTPILPVNLGWCEGPSAATFPHTEHAALVKFYQLENGVRTKAEYIFRIHQLVDESVVFPEGQSGNCPYYQFGRKDPLLPMMGAYNIRNKDYVAGPGFEVTTDPYSLKSEYSSSPTLDFASGIRNPATYYYADAEKRWFWGGATDGGANKPNLWDARSVTNSYDFRNAAIKSVYDPCPPGFMVPHEDVFGNSRHYVRGDDKDDFCKSPYTSPLEAVNKHGWRLYCTENLTSTFFVPFCFQRGSYLDRDAVWGRTPGACVYLWASFDFETVYFCSDAHAWETYNWGIDYDGIAGGKLEDYSCIAAVIRPMAEPDRVDLNVGDVTVDDWNTDLETTINF